jgi:hypothetical protein
LCGGRLISMVATQPACSTLMSLKAGMFFSSKI